MGEKLHNQPVSGLATVGQSSAEGDVEGGASFRAVGEFLGGGELEALLAAAGIGVWVWHPASGEVRWSEGVSQLFGLEQTRFEGSYEHYMMLIHPEDRAVVQAAIQNAVDGGVHYRVDHRIVSCGQDERWLTGVGRVFRASDGSVERMVGIVFDSTERKRAEQRLKESEERFRAFAESAFEGIAFGREGKVLDANRAFSTILGYQPEELIGQDIRDFVAREDAELVEAHMRLGYDLPYEHRAKRKDGSLVWVEASGRKVTYRGEPCRMTSLRDISERKRSERALRERDEMIRALVESSRDWIWAIDLDGRHTYSNPAVEGILGYAPSAVVGKSTSTLLHEEDRAWLNDAFPRWIEAKSGWKNVLLRWRHRDGQYRYLESNAAPILDESGRLKGFRGVDRDITDRVHFEEEKEQLETQLLHAQKMEAVGRLAGGVAHDFNNMLTVILGNLDSALEHIAEQFPGEAELCEPLREAATSAERAGTLTAQLLAFSRRQVCRPEILCVNRQLRELERMLRRLLDENIEFSVVLASELPSVRVDPGQFQQVVMNLVVNARDAMPDGGKLTIETREQGHEVEDEQDGGGALGEHHVVVAVSDSGVGIDPDALDHIFEPFFTTKGLGEGTGLGLATVYGIVAQAGGHVQVISEPEKGTQFNVFLPVSEHALSSSVPEGRIHAARGGDEVVLVCEDEPVVRRLMVRTLERAGYTVFEAPCGADALRLVEQEKPPLQLLVTDVIMPEMNGHRLAETLRPHYPKLRTLYCSGYTADVISHHGVLASGIEFLPKPFKTNVLLERVRELLERPE